MRSLLLFFAVLVVAAPTAAQYEASLVADIRPGPEGGIASIGHDADLFSPTIYDGRLFFGAYDGSAGGLWVYDAETDETTRAAAVSNARDLTVYDNRLFFRATDEETGRELWVYDAATGEAELAVDIDTLSSFGSDPQYLTVYDDRLFFNAVDPQSNGSRLWAYDAATGEATVVGDVPLGTWFYPFHLTVYDDRLFFSAEDSGNDIGRELWVYDAATDAISLAADIAPGIRSSLSDDLAEYPLVYDNRLFVLAENFDSNLWAYDAGTNEASLAAEVFAYYLTVYDERLFFTADGSLGVYDASTGEASTAAGVAGQFLTVYDGSLFFSAEDEDHDVEVWFYDADSAEASIAADINPDDTDNPYDSGSFPEGFIEYDGRLFFSADDGVHGRELWVLSPMPVANEPSTTPQSVRLLAPHPNPAQDHATISFEIAEAGTVRVEVFDVLGRRVALLADGPVAAGEHSLTWKAGTLPSGLYLVRLTSGDTAETQRLTLAR
jgi:ELWxxDGT repeat protein